MQHGATWSERADKEGDVKDGIVADAMKKCGNVPRPGGQKHDAGKPGGFSLIPVEARTAMAAVLSYGQQKYSNPFGWRFVPNAAERYRDAMDRHMIAVDSGEECDPESGLPHLWHVLCNAAFLVALRERK